MDELNPTSKVEVTYSYEHAPTIRRFALSKARTRVLIGPFGCLSGDTEYLSLEGWKRFDEYSERDEIAEFDLETHRIAFREPEAFVKLPCESFLHLHNATGIDQLLSDEHTVLFRTRFQPDKWQTIQALTLANKHNVLKDGWSGCIPTTFKAPDDAPGVDLSDDELRLMVAISADGNLPKEGRQCILTVRKERKKLRLRMLLHKCGVEWDERNYPQRPTETKFSFIPPLRNKDLWRYISATEEQLSIIADEFVHWDGHEDCYGGRIFSSTVSKNADFIQYCLATTGVRATITKIEYDKPNWNDGYRVYAATGATNLSLRQAPKIDRVPSEDGFKYCFTTGTGFFVARRNGRIFITGNSGKSVGALMEIIRKAHEQTPSPIDGIRYTRWAVVRNTFTQLRDTTMKTVFDWFPPEVYGNHKVADHDYIITEFPGVRIELNFRALDRPDHVRNLLSLELTGVWLNEAREIIRPVWEALDGRIGRYPSRRNGGCSWYGCIMDTNPPDEDNWLYKLVEKEKPHNLELFKQPGGRSPQAENIPNLPKGYYEDLAIGKTPEFVRVYIDGEYGFTVEGTPVYQSSYSDSFHVAKNEIEVIPNLNVIAGFDFYRHPACVLSQMTYRGQWRILDELYEDNMGIERFLTQRLEPLLAQKYRGMGIFGYGDPTGTVRSHTDERNAYDVLKQRGFRFIKPAHTNAVMTRIGAVESFLLKNCGPGEPAFLLSPNCLWLRKGFNGGYQYKDGEPKKSEYSHCLAAGTMITTDKGDQPIETLKKGDKVLTPFGYRYILRSWKTRDNAEVMTLKLSNGKEITCTPDHIFVIGSEIICADALQYGTVLETISIKEAVKWNIRRLLNSMGINSGFIRESGIIEDTTRRKRHISISQYGSFITDLCQRVSTFITKTKTPFTMTLATSSLSPIQSIDRTIPLNEPRVTLKDSRRQSKPHERPQEHGMVQKKAEGGIPSTVNKRGLGEKHSRLRASSVVQNMTFCEGQRRKGFAPRLVSLLLDVTAVLIMKKESVLSAVRFLRSIATARQERAVRIVGVKHSADPASVYNITVDKFHCYYANGVLTLNCHDGLQYAALFLQYKAGQFQKQVSRRPQKSYQPATRAGY